MAPKNIPLRSITFLVFLLWTVGSTNASILTNILENINEYLRGSSSHSAQITYRSGDFQETEKYSYDFIIIGAGSGGSVVANRLSEIAHWNILLLEAGGDEIFLTDIPLLAPVMHITSYNWGYKTEPRRKNVDGTGGYCLSMINGRCNWPRGKAVGGTSVINFMIHSRGSKNDFDEWAAMGNRGWSYEEILPYFHKSEKAHLVEDERRGVNASIYGKKGYLDVTTPSWRSVLSDAFLEAGEQLGYRIKDSNDGDPMGFGISKTNIRGGGRVSAAKAFIKPIRHRSNFHLSRFSRVTRIIINPETKTATGVEFVRDSKTYVVEARKEIILSAGSLNSPQLLMLSGVGPQNHLTNLGIQIIQDLPVGHNLQDHVSMAALTFLVNDSVTIVEPRIASNYKNTFDYWIRGTGPFTVPAGAEALAFIDTQATNHYVHKRFTNYDSKITPRNDMDGEPDIELVFGIGSMAGDASGVMRSIFGLPDDWYDKVFKQYEGQDGFSIVPVLLHPKSRGRVTLRSSNPFHSPILQANYFDNNEDLQTIVRGIKKAIEVASTRAFEKYNATLLPVKFPGCTDLDFQSDKYWACVSRQVSTTLGHFVGTCKMAPREADGVVDERLKVYGVKKLRVVDASVMPLLVSGHTNAPTYMIGEKASDMIKEDWL
ncbi:glucose dehydrogenase [FAD, quinone]-like [Fopius arisanus]|uniref:Glucose dehydrogenase [FAD, quinone]-like n=1 Tax=Fopius arisanus TaxID=64838 RepID=A0A9R1STD8_9HYME|nr:PREDICTED: glucose dehydrogenase [FAD, quinone]-like [Fopius arisanus]XP_011296797.1 PREDICTED: glucose dehydrogenase [FAD, quinone]-like [Fopius arisanus]